MNSKTKNLIIYLACIAAIGMGIGIFLIARNSGSENSSASSVLPITTITSSWLPLLAIFIVTSQPTYPVTNSIIYLSYKKYSREKKCKQLDYYVSKSFKESPKYNALLDMILVKYKKAEVKEKGTDRNIIRVLLENGEEYEFEVVKKTKENTVKWSGAWVINDFVKLEQNV